MPSRLLLVAILETGILSHEVFAFLALPSCAYLFWVGGNGFSRGNNSVMPALNLTLAVAKHLRSLLWMLVPLLAFLAVVKHPGSHQQAKEIYDSWASSISPVLLEEIPSGSLAWLARSSQYAAESTRDILATSHYGIPYWAIVFFASFSGVVLVAMANVANFPQCVDQGRWIVLCICSAFIITIEANNTLLHNAFRSLRFQLGSIGSKSWITWLCPLGLGLWGIPHIGWSLNQWLWASPFGSLVLKSYYYLRIAAFLIPGIFCRDSSAKHLSKVFLMRLLL
jgi:hypothetical protein